MMKDYTEIHLIYSYYSNAITFFNIERYREKERHVTPRGRQDNFWKTERKWEKKLDDRNKHIPGFALISIRQ